MAKVASRPDVSPPIKQTPPDSTNSSEPFDPRDLLTMTEDESMQVYEARCMLKLLEDMAMFGEREITMSRGAFVAMMSVIRQKLAFSARIIATDDEDFSEDQE